LKLLGKDANDMVNILKIGFRNMIKNRKKSIFVCIAVFLSLYLLLISNAFVNGMRMQITNAYINIQSGDVAVMWKNHYNVSTLLPGKFVNPNTTKSFNVEDEEKNLEAIKVLDKYLEDNSDSVDFYSKIIRRTANFVVNDKSYSVLIYGLEQQDIDNMEKTKTFSIESGKWPIEENEVVISRQRADTCNLKIGDTVKLSGYTVHNKEVTKEYKITGIYTNGAEYNNFYAITTPSSARSFYDIKDNMFDMVKIYLKNQEDAENFANKLDGLLMAKSDVLRAQDYYNAGLFFTGLSPLLKEIYKWFVVVLLITISIGLRAVIRTNIFSSMKEFGIMRAIGFSKIKCFFIVFFELFLISLISLILSLGSVMTFVVLFAEKGLHIGTNYMTNAFGGEYLYFILKPTDYIFAFLVLLIFVLISTIPPVAKLCNGKITDLLNKRVQEN
jgi:ABC-type lipoprotein release transport system permease subunit